MSRNHQIRDEVCHRSREIYHNQVDPMDACIDPDWRGMVFSDIFIGCLLSIRRL